MADRKVTLAEIDNLGLPLKLHDNGDGSWSLVPFTTGGGSGTEEVWGPDVDGDPITHPPVLIGGDASGVVRRLTATPNGVLVTVRQTSPGTFDNFGDIYARPSLDRDSNIETPMVLEYVYDSDADRWHRARGDARGAFVKGTPDVEGAWSYYAGTSGTRTITGRVLSVEAIALESGGSMSINGGDAIPIPYGSTDRVSSAFGFSPLGNLVDPSITFTGTDSYFVQVVV